MRGSLLVGVVVAAVCLGGCTGAPPAAPTTTGSAMPSVTNPDPWADLPPGQPPTVAYVVGSRLVKPDGTVARLAMGRRGVTGAVPYAGGWLVSDAVWFEGTNGLHLVRDGRQVRAWPSAQHCSSGSAVRSADGRYVAWATVFCPESGEETIGAIHRARADGSQEVTEPIGAELAHVVGFLGSEVIYESWTDSARVTDFSADPRRIRGVEHVLAVSPTEDLFLAGRDEVSEVVDHEGQVLWHGRTGTLTSFGPGGTTVLSVVSRRRLDLFDARTGVLRTTLTVPRGADAWSATWESEGSLLVLVRRHRWAAIARVRLDGTSQRVTRPLRRRGASTPYVLLPRS